MTRRGRTALRTVFALLLVGAVAFLGVAPRQVGASAHGVSHGGLTPLGRQVIARDDQLRAITAKGGLIGIGYFEGAVCALGAAAIVRAIMGGNVLQFLLRTLPVAQAQDVRSGAAR